MEGEGEGALVRAKWSSKIISPNDQKLRAMTSIRSQPAKKVVPPTRAKVTTNILET